MNDEDDRERLSAYLDDALPEVERKALEAQLACSEDLRRELDALRAVSGAVKGLPKAKLPYGFMARLQARRARSSAPERDWVLLPPGYRLPALALSTALVALVVWDKTHAPSEFVAPHVGWKGDRIALKTAAEAPVSQMDLSGRLSALNAASPAAAPDRALGLGRGLASTRRWDAAGKPVEVVEEKSRVAARTFKARNEEERSAINERLYKEFEQEKKRMGIAKILDKESDDRGDGPTDAAPFTQEALGLDVTPAALLAKVIVLKNTEALQTAWAAAGLAGEPPAVDFPKQMALFLACPPGCGIVSVQTGKKLKFLTVLYKDSGFADASARVRAVPASSKLVILMLAP